MSNLHSPGCWAHDYFKASIQQRVAHVIVCHPQGLSVSTDLGPVFCPWTLGTARYAVTASRGPHYYW
jgi:hypothetical protein